VFQAWGGLTLGAASRLLDGDLSYGASFGLQTGAGWVWRVFGLGAELRATWYGAADSNSDYYTDYYEGTALSSQEIVLKPRLGHKLEQLPLELYVSVPHGAARLSGGMYDGYSNAAFSIGLLVGATYFLGEHLGINAELGYTGRFGPQALTELTVLRVSALFGK
jgi:hypothetical protein